MAGAVVSRQSEWVTTRLLELGRQREDDLRTGRRRHANDPAADRLLHDNTFALLLGILAQQWRTPAGAAWEVPWRLQEQLGRLDASSLAADPAAVRAAFASGKVCRRPTRMAEVAIRAAGRVISEYGGEAGEVWAGITDPAELAARIRAFYGAGPKISAMAVSVLRRGFGLELGKGGDIAVDDNVRRVFRRTGLATVNGADDDIRAAARHLHPTDPSELDLGTWAIGAEWCKRRAVCRTCPLRRGCPSSVAVQAEHVGAAPAATNTGDNVDHVLDERVH